MLNLLIAVCLVYVIALFGVAYLAERAAVQGRDAWLRSPLVYTLSLSIYCTAWTFYGAVGFAARSGLEFVTIYLGPTLVVIGWWWVLRRLVRIGRAQRITSIADLISSRFGKSSVLAATVTLIAVVGTAPYIALQLQSVTQSFAIFAEAGGGPAASGMSGTNVTLWVAGGLALFTVLFGTRNLDANERHHGVVIAIAVEAVVKLLALLAVGVFVVWGMADGLADTLQRIDASQIGTWQMDGSRWVGLSILSAAAFLCLPRMFQVTVVENADEDHLRTASWAFPGYLFLMSLFVLPIAVIGLEMAPAGANPDFFVLSLPLSQGQGGLAMLSFLGGFSSATSMVIVASIAISTMVSNHVVIPIWLSLRGKGASGTGDVRDLVLASRRLSILGIVGLGYLYFRMSGGGTALASIGLVAFVGLAQVLPSMLGGLFWRGATAAGALTGLIVGFAMWLFTSFLPSLGPDVVLSATTMQTGLWGLDWLRPTALFGIEGMDPVMHALLWATSLNTVAFLIVSILTFPSPLERLQGAQFVNVFELSSGPRGWSGNVAQSEDLLIMSQRIIGTDEARALFSAAARRQGHTRPLPDPTPAFLETLERKLAGSVGAAAAHAMVGQIVGGASVSVEDLLAVADEAAQIMEYSSRLEAQSAELGRTARQLREANEKLTALSVQKDAFLSQVSHELRTPMTSIRAFSEILREGDVGSENQRRYATIIHAETLRLTRLLDDLLDLSVLENGQVSLNIREVQLCDILDRATESAGLAQAAGPTALRVRRNRENEAVSLVTDPDRLAQVFINLMSNAAKYCDAEFPQLTVVVQQGPDGLIVDFNDNGSGIPAGARDIVFEKFARLSNASVGGAGLGLAICREIMERLGGRIEYWPGQGGASFRLHLPRPLAQAAQ